MPQLDFSTYLSQLFWLAISFGLLYYFVSKIFLPRLNEILSKRSKMIESTDEQIRLTKLEIEKIRLSYSKVIDDAKFAAQNIVADADILSGHLKDEAQSKIAVSVEKMYDENNSQMQQLVNGIDTEIKRLCFDLAMQYYKILLSGRISEKSVDFSRVMSVAAKNVDKFSLRDWRCQ